MWPVMTITLLLQLTDDEQLYARQEPVQEVQTIEQPTTHPAEQAVVAWPVEAQG